ncbi:hypothetical protein O181_086936 [Austropuccinia psidii MF-1]|uniref:DDE Tnp4 domain-containing protein n=1 Tax=Austropuccinia psidii MF-1 TaxID=1389203 RepID=A0A9Q3P4M2_9BASI|nr:hypothetical protein [Austropuccinia psidii MF-1]
MFNVKKATAYQVTKFPATDYIKRWAEIKETFRQRQGLQNIIGAIDGTHIPIISPENDEWNSYVYGGPPGSGQDSGVFRKSQIGQDLINGVERFPPDFLRIGDSGYSSRLPILVSLRNPQEEEGENLNNIHSSTR